MKNIYKISFENTNNTMNLPIWLSDPTLFDDQVYTFGKFKDKDLTTHDLTTKDPNYLYWIASDDFLPFDSTTTHLKQVAKDWIDTNPIFNPSFPFGKYKHMTIEDVAIKDSEYLHWIASINFIHSDIITYNLKKLAQKWIDSQPVLPLTGPLSSRIKQILYWPSHTRQNFNDITNLKSFQFTHISIPKENKFEMLNAIYPQGFRFFIDYLMCRLFCELSKQTKIYDSYSRKILGHTTFDFAKSYTKYCDLSLSTESIIKDICIVSFSRAIVLNNFNIESAERLLTNITYHFNIFDFNNIKSLITEHIFPEISKISNIKINYDVDDGEFHTKGQVYINDMMVDWEISKYINDDYSKLKLFTCASLMVPIFVKKIININILNFNIAICNIESYTIDDRKTLIKNISDYKDTKSDLNLTNIIQTTSKQKIPTISNQISKIPTISKTTNIKNPVPVITTITSKSIPLPNINSKSIPLPNINSGISNTSSISNINSGISNASSVTSINSGISHGSNSNISLLINNTSGINPQIKIKQLNIISQSSQNMCVNNKQVLLKISDQKEIKKVGLVHIAPTQSININKSLYGDQLAYYKLFSKQNNSSNKSFRKSTQ